MTKHLTRRRAVAASVTLLLAVAAPTAYAAFDDAASSSSVAPARVEPARVEPARLEPARLESATTRGEPYVESRLFFGTARPDGGPAVTDAQFTRFVDQEITPGFPEGLTVQSGYGQWRDASGTIEKERSYELILLYPVARAAANDRKIEEIRRAYEKEFGQEAVARADERTRVDF